MLNYHWDDNKTRLNLVKQCRHGDYNLFFIPGGAGMDSRYLHELIHAYEFPGTCWAVDFPGNGDNDVLGAEENFARWNHYLLDVIRAYDNPIIVGHSYGAMLALTTPELEELLKGLIIINSSPECWVAAREEKILDKNLPPIADAYSYFRDNKSEENYHQFLRICLPHLFTESTMEKGFNMYKSLPYNFEAYEWWGTHGPGNYTASWIPQKVPTLICCGIEDYVTPAKLFLDDSRFQRDNIEMLAVPDAGHFCWLEQMPLVVKRIGQYFHRLG